MTNQPTGTQGISFAVAEVEPATVPLPQAAYHVALGHQLATQRRGRPGAHRQVEACARYHGQLVADVRYHPFVAALEAAYAGHRPVSLSPDMIWLLICQGIAHHVNAHAEALRPQFVRHQGRVRLKVRRDDFCKGSPENPWPEVFGELSAQIQAHVGPKHALFVPSFSTTGPAERAAVEVVLLGAMQRYFSYAISRIICGIPAVTLEGTPADWRGIVDRLAGFAPLSVDWWLTPLRGVLEQFCAAAQGDVDRDFWRSIYRVYTPEEPCSPKSATGWVHLFFPYLADDDGRATRPNPWLSGERDPQELPVPDGSGRTAFLYERDFPAGLATAPFVWEERLLDGWTHHRWDMEFLGGFVGVAQDPRTLGLRPEIGWAVREGGSSGG